MVELFCASRKYLYDKTEKEFFFFCVKDNVVLSLHIGSWKLEITPLSFSHSDKDLTNEWLSIETEKCRFGNFVQQNNKFIANLNSFKEER